MQNQELVKWQRKHITFKLPKRGIFKFGYTWHNQNRLLLKTDFKKLEYFPFPFSKNAVPDKMLFPLVCSNGKKQLHLSINSRTRIEYIALLKKLRCILPYLQKNQTTKLRERWTTKVNRQNALQVVSRQLLRTLFLFNIY